MGERLRMREQERLNFRHSGLVWAQSEKARGHFTELKKRSK